MSFKTRCHTVGLNLKFSNYLLQPLFTGGGKNPNYVLKIAPKTCAKGRLTTLCRFKIKVVKGGTGHSDKLSL